MALQNSTTKFGVTFPYAYFRVESVNISKGGGFSVAVTVYSTSDVADSNPGENIDYTTYNFTWQTPVTGNDPIAQAYALLKTLPEFSGAADV